MVFFFLLPSEHFFVSGSASESMCESLFLLIGSFVLLYLSESEDDEKRGIRCTILDTLSVNGRKEMGTGNPAQMGLCVDV